MDGWNTNSFSFGLDGLSFQGLWLGRFQGRFLFSINFETLKTTDAQASKKKQGVTINSQNPRELQGFHPQICGDAQKYGSKNPKTAERPNRLLALQRNSTFEAPSLVQPSAQCIFLAIFFYKIQQLPGRNLEFAADVFGVEDFFSIGFI